MMNQAPADPLAALKAEFDQAVSEFNTAMGGKKIRAKQAAASIAHRAVWEILTRLKAQHPEQTDLLANVEATLMDIRWGRAIAGVQT